MTTRHIYRADWSEEASEWKYEADLWMLRGYAASECYVRVIAVNIPPTGMTHEYWYPETFDGMAGGLNGYYSRLVLQDLRSVITVNRLIADDQTDYLQAGEVIVRYGYYSGVQEFGVYEVHLHREANASTAISDDALPEEAEGFRNLRWTVPFTSMGGAECVVRIYCKDWKGEPVTLTAAAEPFTFTEDMETDMAQYVRAKTGYLRVVETREGELDGLRPTTPRSRYVTVAKGGQVVFDGYLQCREYSDSFTACPREVELEVTSALGLARELTFARPDKTDYLGRPIVTLGEVLDNAIGVTWMHTIYQVFDPCGKDLWKTPHLQSLTVPFNGSFKHYDNPRYVTAPRTLGFFFNGLGAWLDAMVHDIPGGWCLRGVGDTQTHRSRDFQWGRTSEAGGIETLDLTAHFTPCGRRSTRISTPPPARLAVKSEGGAPSDKLGVEFSRYAGQVDVVTPKLEYLGWDVAVDNTQKTYPMGKSGDLVDPEKTTGDDQWVTTHTQSTQDSGGFLTKHFYGFRCASKRIGMKIALSYRNNDGSDGEAFDLDNLRMKLCWKPRSGAAKYLHTYTSGRTKSWGWQETAYFVDVKTYTDGSGDALRYLTIADIPAPAGAATEAGVYSVTLKFAGSAGAGRKGIDTLEIFDRQSRNEERGYVNSSEHRDEVTLGGYPGGDGEKTITLNFHDYPQMKTSGYMPTSGLPEYKNLAASSRYHHMLQPQQWIRLEARMHTPLTHPAGVYAKNWRLPGTEGVWMAVAHGMNLRDDLHTFLFAKIRD